MHSDALLIWYNTIYMDGFSAKRIALILVALIVVAISAFSVLTKEGGEEKFENVTVQEQQSFTEILKAEPEKDTDADGLKDWQEALWQTDKNNPDTDGDGTSDGEEVVNNRNPLKAGPDDEMAQSNTEITTETTLTEEFSKDVFAQYLTLKDSGVEFNSETELAFADSILNSNYLAIPIQEYTVDDLRVVSNINQLDYAENMGLLLKAHSLSPEKSETAVFAEYSQTNDASALESLDVPIKNYVSLRDSVLQLEVPQDLADIHLGFINNLGGAISGLGSSKALQEDPLLGVIGITVYQNSILAIQQTLEQAKNFYKEKNITFEQGSGGYVFLYGL